MDRRKLLVGLVASVIGARPAWADVKIGVKITAPVPPPPVVVAPAPVVVVPAPPPPVVVAPPPPPVVVAAPRVIVIPGSPVYYAPGVNFNMFVYDGRYYSFHHGVWFRARRHSGPWKVVDLREVPRPVRGVPVKYYRVPPGHMKRVGGPGGPQPPARRGGPPPHAGRGHDGPSKGRGRD